MASRFTFHASPPLRTPHSALRTGFTLIEIMIVVGIMGIVLTMGVPIVYKVWHKAPINQAIHDVVEVCSNARRMAILSNHEVDLIFRPQDGTFHVQNAPSAPAAAPAPGNARQPAPPPAPFEAAAASNGSGTSGQFSKDVAIYMLDIGKQPYDFKDDEQAIVRFFPNGTCDELTLVIGTDPIQTYQIRLEVTTSLANVESNARKFR